jgi:prepilin-type N-terminal cleavage/methylation domain-containing protein
MMRSAETKVRGFTLIELAVVIVIVALLLGALLVPLATQVQGRNIKETRKALNEIKEALLGYAVTQGRLPCPDTDRDGLENACSGVPIPIDVVEGFLPWQDLAVPATDAWGRIYRYAVAREFTELAQPGAPAAFGQLDLTDVPTATISVFTRGDDPSVGGGGETKEPIQLTGSAPAIVLSVGSNGLGGSVLGGPDMAFAAAGDELVNVSAIFPAAAPGRTFRQRLHTPASTPCSDTVEGQSFCEFDDILIWLSGPVLLNRMVEARQLP